MLKKIALVLALVPGVAMANNPGFGAPSFNGGGIINIGIGFPAPQPQATLAGSWSFVAKCPLVTTFGTASIQMTSPVSYTGSFTDSLGQTGAITGQLNGQSFSHSARTQWVSVVENGVLSPDGRSYTLTNSVGCQVSATRS